LFSVYKCCEIRQLPSISFKSLSADKVIELLTVTTLYRILQSYYMIQLSILTCAQEQTSSQLSLPHDTIN